MWTFCDFREKHHRAEQVSDIFLIGKSQNCGPFQEKGSIDPQTLPLPTGLPCTLELGLGEPQEYVSYTYKHV